MSFQSIVPPEALVPEPQIAPQELCGCRYGILEGRRDEQGNLTIARMISTDPAAYLDQRYQPGQIASPDALGPVNQTGIS